MRFALLGDHSDGLAVAAAFLATGRHELVYYSGPPLDDSWRERFHPAARENDLEEILADPAVAFVIVASRFDLRMAHLRRVLQSERHALCVHPVSDKPDAAYEAGMLQQETHQVVLPLLGHGLHPAICRLRELLASRRTMPVSAGTRPVRTLQAVGDQRIRATASTALLAAEHGLTEHRPVEANGMPHPTVGVELLRLDYATTSSALFNADSDEFVPGIPIWDLLRAVGGEVTEVAAFGPGEELTTAAPVLLNGQIGDGNLYSATLLSNQPSERLQIRVLHGANETELLFPHGWDGPALLGWRGDDGEWREEAWDARDIWPQFVEAFEEAIAQPSTSRLTWQDAIRSLELDDAARRSVRRRKAIHVEYPEASEEISFKGTMTLVGCAILWGIIVLAVLSHWVPWAGWGVVPLLCVFLFMQVFRWVIPPREEPATAQSEKGNHGP